MSNVVQIRADRTHPAAVILGGETARVQARMRGAAITPGRRAEVTVRPRGAVVDSRGRRGIVELKVLTAPAVGNAAANFHTDNFVADALMLADKFVTLSRTPADPAKVELSIFSGIEQRPNLDFVVAADQLSWDGLAIELLLEVGTAFAVRYVSQ